jgi:hypothetical protein
MAKKDALIALLGLKMKDEDVLGYINLFNNLLIKAQWGANDQGTIQWFCDSLQMGLHKDIVTLELVQPTTLKEWQDTTIKCYRQFVEARAITNPFGGRLDRRQHLALTLGCYPSRPA